jgi:hypothetical protein
MFMLSAIRLSAMMMHALCQVLHFNSYAECHYAESCYALCLYHECLFAECHGANWFSRYKEVTCIILAFHFIQSSPVKLLYLHFLMSDSTFFNYDESSSLNFRLKLKQRTWWKLYLNLKNLVVHFLFWTTFKMESPSYLNIREQEHYW